MAKQKTRQGELRSTRGVDKEPVPPARRATNERREHANHRVKTGCRLAPLQFLPQGLQFGKGLEVLGAARGALDSDQRIEI